MSKVKTSNLGIANRNFVLGCFLLIASFSANGQSTYILGNSTQFNLGLDLNQALQINPKTTGGESRIGFGLDLLLNHVNFQYKRIWESKLILTLSCQKEGDEILKKNYDNIELSSKYAIKNSYTDKYMLATDLTFRSSILNTYDYKYLFSKDSLQLTSKFLSPMNLTYSIGIDYRVAETSQYLYFAPIAINVLHVSNDQLATKAIYDREGNIIGSLHGNVIPTETQIPYSNANSFSKSKVRLGSNLKANYSYENNRFFWETTLDLFFAYKEINPNDDFNPIQFQWNSRLSFSIHKNLKLSLITDVAYDPDQAFQDTYKENAFTTDKKFNLTQRLTLGFGYNFDKKDR